MKLDGHGPRVPWADVEGGRAEIRIEVAEGARRRTEATLARMDSAVARLQTRATRAGDAFGRRIARGAREAGDAIAGAGQAAVRFGGIVVDRAAAATRALARMRKEAASAADGTAKAPGLLKRAFSGVVSGVGLGLGAKIAGAAVDAVGSALGKPEEYRAMADAAAKSAEFSTEAYGRLAWAAGLSNTSIEEVTKASATLRTALSKKPSPELSAALKDIGVKAEDLRRLGPEERLQAIADGFKNLTGDTQKAQVAGQLFGGELGGKMVPLLEAGGDGLRTMGKEAEALGRVVDGPTAAAAERFGDAQARLGAVVDGVGNRIFQAFVPALADAAEGVYGFIRANDGIINGGIATAVEVLGTVFGDVRDTVLAVIEAVRPQVEALMPLLSEGFAEVRDAVAGLREPAIATIQSILGFVEPLIGAVRLLIPLVSEGLVRAFEAVQAVMASLTSLLGGVLDAFRAFREGRLIDGIKALGKALIDALLAPLRFIAGQLVDLADALGQASLVPAALRRFAGRSATGGAIELARSAVARAQDEVAAAEPATPAETPPPAEAAGRGPKTGKVEAPIKVTGGGGAPAATAFSGAFDKLVKERADRAAFDAAAAVAARGGSVREQQAAARKASKAEERALRNDKALQARVYREEAARRQKEALEGRVTGAFGAVGGAEAVRLDVGAGAGGVPPLAVTSIKVDIAQGAVTITGNDFAADLPTLERAMGSIVDKRLGQAVAEGLQAARSPLLA